MSNTDIEATIEQIRRGAEEILVEEDLIEKLKDNVVLYFNFNPEDFKK